jgi:hypothetical protein
MSLRTPGSTQSVWLHNIRKQFHVCHSDGSVFTYIKPEAARPARFRVESMLWLYTVKKVTIP